VEFVDEVTPETLATCYRACDVFALPSLEEGFGIVYLEAMAFGKPVLAAPLTAVPEVVLDGETGILVDPDREHALVTALVSLLGNPALRKRLGEAGRRRVVEHFSFDRLVERLDEVMFGNRLGEGRRSAA
jgi:glycosyltransferase involved in cell wall biosynthesis